MNALKNLEERATALSNKAQSLVKESKHMTDLLVETCSMVSELAANVDGIKRVLTEVNKQANSVLDTLGAVTSGDVKLTVAEPYEGKGSRPSENQTIDYPDRPLTEGTDEHF